MTQNYDMPGYTLHVTPSDKFKDVTVSVRFKAPLDQKTATARTLLGFVLTTATKTYPTVMDLSGYLDELYGARLGASIAAKGAADIITLTSRCVNQAYLPVEDDLITKQVQLLDDLIHNPLADGDAFDDTIVRLKKKEIADRIVAGMDDKMSYANDELLKYMGEFNTPLSVMSLGSLEDLDVITPQSLYKTYQAMLEEDDVHVYVIGDVPDNIAEVFEKNLNLGTTKPNIPANYTFESTKNDVLEVFEDQDIVQTKLELGYTTGVDFTDPDCEAMSLTADILGGYSQSRLFRHVREERSLCYYISAGYNPFGAVMAISSGINQDNIDAVKDLVAEDLADMQAGNVTEDELALAKMMVVCSLESAYDSPSYMISLQYNRDITGKKQTIAQYIDAINAVSVQDIVRCANKIRLDTVYVLRGKEDAHD